FGNTFTLFDNLSFYVRVEGNGGHKQVNTEIRATHNQATTEAVLRGNNPILQATRVYENDRTGVYEAAFLRLRETSANYIPPERLDQPGDAQRAHALDRAARVEDAPGWVGARADREHDHVGSRGPSDRSGCGRLPDRPAPDRERDDDGPAELLEERNGHEYTP